MDPSGSDPARVVTAEADASPLGPLRQPTFRALWLATLVSHIGTLMQNVGAAWLMMVLTSSPVLTALVQTATHLPTFLLAIPAGALADLVDRRRLLLFTQVWMLCAAALLGVLTLAGAIDPVTLLLLTFSLGVGSALNNPAWQAIVPELVPRADLPAAVALGSVGFNLARATGPALGGALVAAAGASAAFLANAASYLGVLGVLFRWRRPPSDEAPRPEGVLAAMRTGLRYVRGSAHLTGVIVRAAAFTIFGSALWALLPLVARQQLGLGAAGYGTLLAFLGGGAVVGAAALPALRRRIGLDPLLVGATVVYAAMMGVTAVLPNVLAVAAAMLPAGAAWLLLLSSFNTAVQSSAPSWVRGRALALYQLVTFGGLAAGSAIWGAIADLTDVDVALAVAGLGMLAALSWSARHRISSSAG